MSTVDGLLKEAETVAGFLDHRGIPSLLIGAGAMAVHNYVRFTQDIDLGVAVSFQEIRLLEEPMRAQGWEIVFHEPGADDPLDGVVDVETRCGMVQIVNFGGTFPAVIHDALESAPVPISSGSSLMSIPLPYLIALKLYAGGRKAELDILELLSRNPELDRKSLTALCRRYRLRGLAAILREANG